MNVKKLNTAIQTLKDNLEEGLVATDIYMSADGESIAGFNSNPQACALFNRITNYLTDALNGAEFPKLGKYYLLSLTDSFMVMVIPLGDYQWGMLVDTKKVQLGLLLNVVLPKILASFEEAISE